MFEYTQKDVARFWSKVDKSTTDPDGCWTWTKYLDPEGYALIYVKPKMRLVHRFSYLIAYGILPDDLKVLHKCDNPSCVRPDHLFLGTQLDNIRDRDQKGRQAKGEKHFRCRLTDDQVFEVRRLHTEGKTWREVALLIDVSESYYYQLVQRKYRR